MNKIIAVIIMTTAVGCGLDSLPKEAPRPANYMPPPPLPSPPSMQVNNDRCAAILGGGVFDTTVVHRKDEARLAWDRWWLRQDAREAQRSAEAGARLPVDGILVGGTFNAQKFESWKSSAQSRNIGTYASSSDLSVLMSVASQAILSAFNHCIEAEKGVSLFEAATDKESGVLVLYVKFAPAGYGSSLPKVVSSNMFNATLTTPVKGLSRDEFIRPQSQLPFGFIPITVKITDRRKGAVFNLVTDMGSASLQVSLPEQPKPIDPPPAIQLAAQSFTKSQNVEVGVLPYGDDVIHNAPNYKTPKPNMVEYNVTTNFTSAPTASYTLEVEYAAAQSRPVQVEFNGQVVSQAALAATTGGWGVQHQRWFNVGTVEVVSGVNTLRISRTNVFPHIRNIRLTRQP